jgi:hypothetical protein
VTLGGVRQTAIPKNDGAALELVSGGHLNAPPVPSVDPDRLTCGVRVLTLFPSPLRSGIELTGFGDGSNRLAESWRGAC